MPLCMNKLSAMAPRVLFFLSLSIILYFSNGQTWIKSGYWYSGSEFPVPDINSALFTHLMCAFAEINSSTYEVSISPSDQPYFSTFTSIVKKKNLSIKTLLSIWGAKANSSILSSMASQPSYRTSSIKSSIKNSSALWVSWPRPLVDFAKVRHRHDQYGHPP
ncbi:unnamed protein product [Ilex paraguariensis]|uniref:GH18 domain-containing protein n=1 Tax=Ilex paraguariensis TaxID=185542 RepID=A0ABC8TH86_9AQUA